MARIIIEPAQPRELAEAAVLLSHSMIVLPETKVVFRGRRDRLERFFKIALVRLPGRVLLARDDGKIAGVMRMVEWPQCSEMPFLQRLVLMAHMIKALRGTFLRAMKFHSIWAKHDPQKPHWHLGPVAVLPGRQRRGIGAKLIEHFCEHVDRLGAAGYLETGSRENVRFYGRFGFSVTGEAPVFGVPTWFMWRPPSEEKSP